MASKYDTYWQSRIDTILNLFEQAHQQGTSRELDLSDITALGNRSSWNGKVELVAGDIVYHSMAHMQALGELLVKRLPTWAMQQSWAVSMTNQQQLSVKQIEPEKTTWFESGYRNAKLDETVRQAQTHLGPLVSSDLGYPCYRRQDGGELYVLFSSQKDGWFAPRAAGIDRFIERKGHLLLSFTDDNSAIMTLWYIPVAELMQRVQEQGYKPTLDGGKSYSFNLQIGDQADVIRQLDWNVRQYRLGHVDSALTRTTYHPGVNLQVTHQKSAFAGAGQRQQFDLAQRLQQWQREATDPHNPNYGHADLNEVAQRYARISSLLTKLRTMPEQFEQDDVVALFGALNSGQRTKTKIIRDNSLPAVRQALIELITDGGDPASKIEAANGAIKQAGMRMLGELYGWAYAEKSPLYNTCATDALRHLVNDFDPENYDEFVETHQRFKALYLQHLAPIRPDLPLNLEIDKFYNVIDKVDLKLAHVVPEVTVFPDAPFTHETFSLLERLHDNPTVDFYLANKDGFTQHVESPFKSIFMQVAERLPAPISSIMETEKRIFSRFPKNDFGQGGTWDFYWAAFYPKGSKRSLDAQLSMWMNYQYLEFGFFVGNYASEQRQRLQRNCETHFQALKEILAPALADARFLFGAREEFQIDDQGKVTLRIPRTWEEFLRNPSAANCDVSVVVPSQELLNTTTAALVKRIVDAHQRLFPLVLLALEEEPLPIIASYFEAIGMEDEEDVPETPEMSEPIPQPYLRTDFLDETYLSEVMADELWELLQEKKQLIFYGPPGTGKSYVAQRLARWVVNLAEPSHEQVEMVQFHPAYSYEDFIEGIRPESKAIGDGRFTVDYPPKPGIFVQFCRRARQLPGKPHVFIIDEINRGNIPRIFGELMLLLEYRNRDVPLPYSGTRFQIPPNVYLIGTMNTADRSIALVDFALRRRFHFVHMGAAPDVLARWLAQNPTEISYLATLYEALCTTAIDDPNYAVGPSYFMQPHLTEVQLARIWRRSIEPYLEEYHIDQPSNARRWAWDGEMVRRLREEP